jgi:hypothetical protein
MKRKATLLVVSCAFLVLVYLALSGISRPRYCAHGQILLRLNLNWPTNEPAKSDCSIKVDKCHGELLSGISNRLMSAESKTVLFQNPVRRNGDVQLLEVYPIRNTHLIGVSFCGYEASEVWHVASNACVVITQFYGTNRPFELGPTNPVTWDVEHRDTYFWKPKPPWRLALDWLRNLTPW